MLSGQLTAATPGAPPSAANPGRAVAAEASLPLGGAETSVERHLPEPLDGRTVAPPSMDDRERSH